MKGVDLTSIIVACSRRLKIATQRVLDQIDGTFLTAKRRRFKGGLYL